MKPLLSLACVLTLATASAEAADRGIYFDVGLGQSLVKDFDKADWDANLSTVGTLSSSSLDDRGSVWSAAVGYRPSRYFAADIGYVDLGAATYRANLNISGTEVQYKASANSYGPTLAAMGILPLGRKFELQGRAGLFFAKTAWKQYMADSSGNDSYAYDANTHELFYGVGAAYKFTKTFAMHLNVSRYSKVGDKDETGESDIDAAIIGFTFSQ